MMGWHYPMLFPACVVKSWYVIFVPVVNIKSLILHTQTIVHDVWDEHVGVSKMESS